MRTRASWLQPALGCAAFHEVFGPPVRSEEGLGVCELCYHGATEEEIAACEMPVDPDGLEAKLLQEFEQTSGRHGRTLVAFALAGNRPSEIPFGDGAGTIG